MKLLLIVGLGVGMALAGFAADDPMVKTPKGKLSYGLGMDIGRNITNTLIEVDAEALAAGLKAVVSGGKSLLTEAEAREAMNDFRSQMQAKQAERQKLMQDQQKQAGEKNKKDGMEFLAKNKSAEGVKTTPSGLQYKIMTQGKGKIPTPDDTVICHYRGTLIDGSEFDSSYKRGEPAKFPVKGVIKGWTEALQMMPVGSKWQLSIPSDLAYGDAQRPSIPAGSTLLFDIELVGIEGQEEKK
jgi:FKBP-type peptidyl-prolyl cis-trans isomerase